jgi:hypothetical protein
MAGPLFQSAGARYRYSTQGNSLVQWNSTTEIPYSGRKEQLQLKTIWQLKELGLPIQKTGTFVTPWL